MLLLVNFWTTRNHIHVGLPGDAMFRLVTRCSTPNQILNRFIMIDQDDFNRPTNSQAFISTPKDKFNN
jgi:hypothetical protein